MFNDCSVFSLGHRSVDADFKPHFSCNYCGIMHISMSVILGQSIAVGCFFFKGKKIFSGKPPAHGNPEMG